MDPTCDAIREAIRDVPDFPRPGIVFKDITPVLQDARRLADVVRAFTRRWRTEVVHKVAGIESRGFVFGAPLAVELGAGFVPLRKKGKLPWRCASQTYDLEYGTETLEVHVDAIAPGERVLLVDDLLATGGTAQASLRLIEGLGGVVCGAAFVVELAFLGGRARLGGIEPQVLVRYD